MDMPGNFVRLCTVLILELKPYVIFDLASDIKNRNICLKLQESCRIESAITTMLLETCLESRMEQA